MSGATPIAEAAEQELNGSERDKQAARRNVYPGGEYAPYDGTHSGRASGTPITSNADFMTDLLDAQQRLISAHHQYLHDSDMTALARAQLDVINVHNSVLGRLGVFG